MQAISQEKISKSTVVVKKYKGEIMKKSFLNANEPFVTVMVQEKTAKAAEFKIRNAVADGATAVGLQLSSMQAEYKTKETLSALVLAAEGRPMYLTNYRGGSNEGKTDDELAEGLLQSLDCGVTLVDIMGDMFCPAPEELTTDEKAIQKQMDLIKKVHEKGGEVLMSSHVYEYRSPERVLEMALEQQRRGADVVKIVTGANTEDEQLKNLEICHLLKTKLKVPFLFLSAGACTNLHRTLGPALGVNMWLCFREYDETAYPGPPLLSNVLKIKQGLKL